MYVPGAGGVQSVIKLAVDTPAVVLIVPLPLTLGTVLQVLSLYRAKLTDPLGAVPVVPENVAVSLRLGMSTPTVPVAGLACVVIDNPLAAAWDCGPNTNNPTATAPADPRASARRTYEQLLGRVRCPLTFGPIPHPPPLVAGT